MRVQFYGRLADLIGRRHLDDIPDTLADGEALRGWLADAHPQLAEVLARPGTRLVVDNEIADWSAALAAAGDIAVIPAVSGG